MARNWQERDRYDQWSSDRNRDWSDRAGDEVRSWFGDDDAQRRRMKDDQRGNEFTYDRSSPGQYSGSYGYGGYADREGPYHAYAEPRDYGFGRGIDRGYGDRPRAAFGSDMYGEGRYGRRPGYGTSGGYGGRDYGRSDERGLMDRAGDEIASWFGNEDAQRRRDVDAGHRGRGPKSYVRSDDRIKEDVNDRLSDDPHINASDVEVSVSGGEVTLTGMVEERSPKRHAEDIAELVSGVKHIQNNLRVNTLQTSAGWGTTGAR